MKQTLNVLVVLLLMLGTTYQANAQDADDLKIAKTIAKVKDWECTKLQKDGREIDVKAIAGDVYMTFNSRVEKKMKEVELKNGKTKKKKVKSTINSFKMEMGGNDRIFEYKIEGDSVKFDSVKGFNDYRIVRADKDELVLEQALDDSIFRWTMIPSEDK
jgi:hypothetical protein